MIKQLLNQNWFLQKNNCETSFPTAIPTSVYTVLADNNQIPDPYWKDNEDVVRDVINDDYTYTCTFSPLPEFLEEDACILRFDGIDTISDVYLNNVLLGHTANMHRTWEFDVTTLLLQGENQLKIVLHSPLKAAKEAFAQCPTRGSEDAWEGFSHIRKAHYMYGWDWGAHLPDAGIFRDVTLLGVKKARIDSVYVTQKHEENKVTLHFAPSFFLPHQLGEELSFENLSKTGNTDFTYTVTVTDPNGLSQTLQDNPTQMEITSPKLWFPNGLGAQPLYTIKLELYAGNDFVDAWERKIGLRTLTMCVEKD